MITLDQVKAAVSTWLPEGTLIPVETKMAVPADLIGMEAAEPKRKGHHDWLHPTKGWRRFSRPTKCGTHRISRRRLITAGALQVPGSREGNRLTVRSGNRWPKMRP